MTTHYTVEKARVYQHGERYNSGEGLTVSLTDRQRALCLFHVLATPEPGRTYAVELREGDTVLLRTAAGLAEAHRSMWHATQGWPAPASNFRPSHLRGLASHAESMYDALKVLTLTPHIRAYLMANDPQALGQAEKAAGEYEEALS